MAAMLLQDADQNRSIIKKDLHYFAGPFLLSFKLSYFKSWYTIKLDM